MEQQAGQLARRPVKVGGDPVKVGGDPVKVGGDPVKVGGDPVVRVGTTQQKNTLFT
jgi:uncharacterized Zn-binding protein involved in type VI secretion